LFLQTIKILFKWVDGNVEKRAWYLASFAPKKLFRDAHKPCTAREILIRSGDRKDVRSNLMANLSTQGRPGPGSLHLQNKKRGLLELKEGETEERVIRWFVEQVNSIDQEIKRELIREERDGYQFTLINRFSSKL
jgi:hypothetical protein